MLKEFSPVNNRIDELRTELKKVKKVFDECKKLADELSDTTYDPQLTNLDKLADSQQETSAKLLPYSDELKEVYENIKPLHNKLNAYNTRNEDDASTLHNEFSVLQTAHSVNWEHNSIDIAAFDQEADNFRSYCSVQEKMRESLLDLCSSTLTNYAMLNVETEVVYEVWKEFLKRCDLIRAIADLRQQVTGFTAN